MSVAEASEYRVMEGSDALRHFGFAYKVVADGCAVDAFRSRCAAEYAAGLLNRGVATVDRHAIVGCKVVAR